MLESALEWIGYGLCHQLPARSFFGGGLQVPVCARDTGIYVGFVISLGVIGFLHRGERPSGFPARPAWLVMALMVAVMAWDGVTSYAGIRETTNALRLVTGLTTGYACAALIAPMLNDTMWVSPGPGRVLDPARRLAIWALSVPATFLLVLFGGPALGRAYPLLVTLAVFATLTCVNMVIVGMLPAFDRRGRRWVDLIAPASIGLVIAFAEVAAAGAFRRTLESFARMLGA